MSTWFPEITVESLDGFIVGTLATAAGFLAIIIPWRLRQHGSAARGLVAPAEDLVPLPLDPMTLPGDPAALRGEPVTWAGDPLAVAGYPGPASQEYAGLARGGVAGDQGSASQEYGALARGGVAGYPGPASQEYGALARDDLAAVDAARRWHEAVAEGRPAGHRARHPLGDPAFGPAPGMPRPPGARRPPRHAAPSPSLSGKVTGLLPTRSVPEGKPEQLAGSGRHAL